MADSVATSHTYVVIWLTSVLLDRVHKVESQRPRVDRGSNVGKLVYTGSHKIRIPKTLLDFSRAGSGVIIQVP